MKKVLALLLCLLTICSAVLVSCGSSEEASKEVSTEQQSKAPESSTEVSEVSEEASKENTYTDENGKYVNKNQVEFKDEWKDYKTFTVLSYNNIGQTTYFNEEIESVYETTDDKIAEAVTTRNKEIEDKYGITVKLYAVNDPSTVLNQAISSGSGEFDAVEVFMYTAAKYAQEGNLYDLTQFEGYLDIEAPWWDQNANDSLSIAGRIFFATGDISIMQRIVSGGIAFNKDLLEQYYPDVNLYDLVDAGKWTLDALYELCKDFTAPLNDDGKLDENDQWGCMGAGDGLYYSCGEVLCSKDADDIPVMYIGTTERSITVAQKVLNLINEKNTWAINVGDFTNQADKWNTTVKMFGENQTLFYSFAFSALKKFRPYGVVYGVLPNPKYDEEQEEYYTSCSNMAYGACIPVIVRDAEYSAYMLDLLAVGGKNYLTSAYYTSVLKGRDMNTEDDERMLDIIFSNIVYDTARVYQFSTITNLFSTAKADTLVSTLESLRPAIESAIEDIVESYNSID